MELIQRLSGDEWSLYRDYTEMNGTYTELNRFTKKFLQHHPPSHSVIFGTRLLTTLYIVFYICYLGILYQILATNYSLFFEYLRDKVILIYLQTISIGFKTGLLELYVNHFGG